VSVMRRLRLWAGRLALPARMTRAMPLAAREIGWRLAEAGHEAGFVGGVVRDLLLGLAPKDWDLTTSASLAEIQALFPEGHLMGRARVGAEVGGQTVLIPRHGGNYEVTPYRGEGLAGDLARRDFTFNAMALGLDGRLIDPFGGRRDLARGLVRSPGAPQDRIAEDPLRMLRAVRFAAQLGFRIDPALERAIREGAPLLQRVAPERIGQEWARILLTGRPAWAMEQLRELGLLAQFVPELLESVGVVQNEYHAYPVWEHLLLALETVELAPEDGPAVPGGGEPAAPAQGPTAEAERPTVETQRPPSAARRTADDRSRRLLILRLAALLHDIGKPRTLSTGEDGRRHFYRHELIGAEMVEAILTRLRFESELRAKVVHLVRYHMDLHFDTPPSDAALRRMLRRIGPEHMNDLIQLRRADRIASGTRQGDLGEETIAILQALERVLANDAALKVTDLAITGRDVMQAMNIIPGPAVGKLLENLLQEVLEEPSRNTREWLLGRLAEWRKMGSPAAGESDPTP
jgi:putative nucleotidyltransferase with HDIG domain